MIKRGVVMNIILLSGGSGKRLWPLSNDIRSKQFIKLFKNDNGDYESMLQRMYSGIKSVDESADIVIATSSTQVSSIKNQLGNNVDISIETCRRDTFPAIALACAYLHDVKKVNDNEVVIICPVDPYVDQTYFESLKKLNKLVKDGKKKLFLMGIDPTYPSEKYGYIIPETNDETSTVKMFKEKPTEEKAKEYISNNALWNSGVFAFKIGYIMDIAHSLIDFVDYNDLFNKYEDLNKISFDYAVVEKEDSIGVLKCSGIWKDLGTWNTLTESIDDNILGNGLLDNSSVNTNIVNELNIPILGVGVDNVVIAASPDGILVVNKDCCGKIKEYVEQVEGQVMFAEKSWGTYKIINVEKDSQTILVTLNPGHSMTYHSHNYRNEIWNVISGEGTAIVDDKEISLKPGVVINIPVGVKHTVTASTKLKLVEIQLGTDICVEDKIIYNRN